MLSPENSGHAWAVTTGLWGLPPQRGLARLVSAGSMWWAGGQGPPGKWSPGTQDFQACRFLQCLNREGLCARLPEKSLFTFACIMGEN